MYIFKNTEVKKAFMSTLINCKLNRRADFFLSMELNPVGISPDLQISPSKGEYRQWLEHAASVPPNSLSHWKCLGELCRSQRWGNETHHHPTREIYHSPLPLIELELRFHTAKSQIYFAYLNLKA